jgi:hypothetical protein
MQQRQQPAPWPLSPQQFGAGPGPVGQSPQQQHTPARNAPAAAAAAAGSPSPGLSVVRVIELPDDPDAVAFKLGGYSQVFVDAIKETPFPETGACRVGGGHQMCREGLTRRCACCLCGQVGWAAMHGEGDCRRPARRTDAPAGWL